MIEQAVSRTSIGGSGFDRPSLAPQIQPMCNLYTLDPVLDELAADFDKFLGRRLSLVERF